MKKPFGTLPIRTKVSLVIVLTCSLILVGALALLIGAQLRRARDQHLESIAAAAATVGHDCSTALVFQHEDYARETLQQLELMESVECANVFYPDGRLLCHWEREGGSSKRP